MKIKTLLWIFVFLISIINVYGATLVYDDGETSINGTTGMSSGDLLTTAGWYNVRPADANKDRYLNIANYSSAMGINVKADVVADQGGSCYTLDQNYTSLTISAMVKATSTSVATDEIFAIVYGDSGTGTQTRNFPMFSLKNDNIATKNNWFLGSNYNTGNVSSVATDTNWHKILLHSNSSGLYLYEDDFSTLKVVYEFSNGDQYRGQPCILQFIAGSNYIDDFYVCSGKEDCSIPAGTDTINISVPNPATLSQFNVSTLNFNLTSNSSNNFNCSIYFNDTLNQSWNDIGSGSNVLVNFSQTFGDGDYSYYMFCADSTDITQNETSSTALFYIDTTTPVITWRIPAISNNSYRDKLVTNIGLTDDNLYSYYYNITYPNGTTIFNYTNVSLIGNTTFNITTEINMSNYTGRYIAVVKVCDGHTDEEIDFKSVKKYNEELQFDDIDIHLKDKTKTNTYNYYKKKDRYNFEFKTTFPTNSETFVVKAKEYIDILHGKTPYQGHLIIGEKWVDFVTSDTDSVYIERINNKKVEVTIFKNNPTDLWFFESIGELNCKTDSQDFWIYQANTTTKENVLTREWVTYYLNLTPYNSSFMTSLNANLTFNNTIYPSTGTAIDGTTYGFNVTLQIPLITSQTNFTLKWDYSVDSYSNTTDTENIYAYIPAIDNCSLYNTPFINFSIKDEDDPNVFVNATMTYVFRYWKEDLSSTTFSGITDNSTYTYKFCQYPSWGEFNTNISITYSRSVSSFTSRTYSSNDVSVDNSTDQIDLFLLSNPTDVTFHVIDNDDNDLEGVLIEAYRYYPSNLSDVLVASEYTDPEGNVVFGLKQGTTQYSFKFYQDSVLKIETNRFKLFSTLYEYVIGVYETTRLEEWLKIKTIDTNLTYNNLTNIITFQWYDPNGYSDNFCLNVTDLNSTNTYSNCSNTGGSLAFGIPNLNVSYFADGFARYNTSQLWYMIDDLSIDERDGFRGWFGDTFALILGFIMFITITMLALVNKNLAVVGAMVAGIILYWTGILVGFGSLMGIMVLGFIILFIINKRFE